MNRYLIIGCFSLGLATCLGAFGAHALKGFIDDYSMTIYQRAEFYHIWNSVGLVAISQISSIGTDAVTRHCALLLTTGTAIFSGSLYLLAISGYPWFGLVTPCGGILIIYAWMRLGYHVAKSHRSL